MANKVNTLQAFFIYKKSYWEFPSGKNMFHLSQVPFERATKGMELVIKKRKSVNGTQISIGKFPPGKRVSTFFRNSIYSQAGKFPVEQTKQMCSSYIPTGIS